MVESLIHLLSLLFLVIAIYGIYIALYLVRRAWQDVIYLDRYQHLLMPSKYVQYRRVLSAYRRNHLLRLGVLLNVLVIAILMAAVSVPRPSQVVLYMTLGAITAVIFVIMESRYDKQDRDRMLRDLQWIKKSQSEK